MLQHMAFIWFYMVLHGIYMVLHCIYMVWYWGWSWGVNKTPKSGFSSTDRISLDGQTDPNLVSCAEFSFFIFLSWNWVAIVGINLEMQFVEKKTNQLKLRWEIPSTKTFQARSPTGARFQYTNGTQLIPERLKNNFIYPSISHL